LTACLDSSYLGAPNSLTFRHSENSGQLAWSAQDKRLRHHKTIQSVRVHNPGRHDCEQCFAFRQIRRIDKRRNAPLPLILSQVHPHARCTRHYMPGRLADPVWKRPVKGKDKIECSVVVV
jgi:hypothetical protein